MKFDWYQATIDQPPRVIIDALLAHLPGAVDVVHQAFGGNGYRKSARILDAKGDTIALLLHGSSTAAPNLRASSSNAEPLAHLVRALWPVHRVSRLDVCEDMSNLGLFRRCQMIMKKTALAAGIETGLSFIPDIAIKGRTYRLGGNKSDTMVRLYEKGFEQLGKGQVTEETVDKNLVRLEIQHRPRRPDNKLEMATVEPSMVWGVADWSKEIALKLLKIDVPRIKTQPPKQSEWELAEIHHRMQWANHMIEGGRRLARSDTGQVKPSLVESVDAYWEHLRPLLLDAGRSRGAETVCREPVSDHPFAIH